MAWDWNLVQRDPSWESVFIIIYWLNLEPWFAWITRKRCFLKMFLWFVFTPPELFILQKVLRTVFVPSSDLVILKTNVTTPLLKEWSLSQELSNNHKYSIPNNHLAGCESWVILMSNKQNTSNSICLLTVPQKCFVSIICIYRILNILNIVEVAAIAIMWLKAK